MTGFEQVGQRDRRRAFEEKTGYEKVERASS